MATIQTKLTSDNKQHNEAFKKSKQEVYNYKKMVTETKKEMSSLATDGFKKLAGEIGIAMGVLEAFKQTINSTEITIDKFGSTMQQAKSVVNSFFSTIANGNLGGFISSLKSITENARDAYVALDKLGTDKMWGNARIALLDAQISDARLVGDIAKVNSLLAQRRKIVEGLNDTGKDAAWTTLVDGVGASDPTAFKQLSGRLQGLSPETIKQIQYILSRVGSSSDLDKYINNYYRQNKQFIGHSSTGVMNNNEATVVYEFLKALKTVPEPVLQKYLDIISESNALLQNQSNMERKLNKTSTGGSETEAERKAKERAEMDKTLVLTHDLVTSNSFRNQTGNPDWSIIEIPAEIIVDEEDATEKIRKVAEVAQKAMEDFKRDMNDLCSIGNSFATIFSNIGDMMDDNLGKGFNIAGIIASTIAELLKGYATASAESASYGPYGWAAFSLAGLAQVTAMISQIHSLSGYANGGIIGGNSYVGDKMLARVNSGEMILNHSQQANLFDMINSGGLGGGNVQFHISGSDLVGVINNYNKKTGRVR